MTVTEAARNFADVVARAFYRGESAKLLKNGRVVARIVPAEEAVHFPTGAELARLWGSHERPRLSPAEARALEADLEAAKKALPPLELTPWE